MKKSQLDLESYLQNNRTTTLQNPTKVLENILYQKIDKIL